MKIRPLLTSFFIVITGVLFAQDDNYTKNDYTDLLQRDKIDFKAPKTFKEINLDVNFHKFISTHSFNDKYLYGLISKDKECVVAYSSPMTVIFNPAIHLTPRVLGFMNSYVRWGAIREDIKMAYGEGVNIDDYFATRSGKDAKKHFNADSVFVYTIPIKGDYAKNIEPYTYCIFLKTMSYPYPIIPIYMFLTDEAYQKKDKYISKLDNTIMYKEK